MKIEHDIPSQYLQRAVDAICKIDPVPMIPNPDSELHEPIPEFTRQAWALDYYPRHLKKLVQRVESNEARRQADVSIQDDLIT